MIQKNFRIHMLCNEYRTLDASVQKILETTKKTGASVRGPVPIPNRITKRTVLRSPHVNKKSREQFETRCHKRFLDIINPTPQTVDALMKLDIASGVEVEIVLEK